MSALKLDRVTKASVDKKGRPRRVADDSGAPYVVRTAGAGDTRALAYVERDIPAERLDEYLKDRKRGVRSFVLWQDQYRSRRLGTVRTAPHTVAAKATYTVHGPAGEQLGTVTVEKATVFPPHRARWIVEQAGQAPAVARKGRVIWWWLGLLLLPILAVLAVIAVLGDSGGDVPAPGTPKRTIWRSGTEAVLDYRSSGTYHDPAPWLAPQLTAALIALHQSHESGTASGQSWDAQKTPPASGPAQGVR
jgi:hypothetical protein